MPEGACTEGPAEGPPPEGLAAPCCLPAPVLAALRLLTLLVFQVFFGLFLTLTTGWIGSLHTWCVVIFTAGFILHMGFCMCSDGWCAGSGAVSARRPGSSGPSSRKKEGPSAEFSAKKKNGRSPNRGILGANYGTVVPSTSPSGENDGAVAGTDTNVVDEERPPGVFCDEGKDRIGTPDLAVVVVEGTPLAVGSPAGLRALPSSAAVKIKTPGGTAPRTAPLVGGFGRLCFFLQYLVAIVAILGISFVGYLGGRGQQHPTTLLWGWWLGECLGILAIIWWAPLHLFAIRYDRAAHRAGNSSAKSGTRSSASADHQHSRACAPTAGSAWWSSSSDDGEEDLYVDQRTSSGFNSAPPTPFLPLWLWTFLCGVPTVYVWALPLLSRAGFAVDAREGVGFSISMYTSNPHATGALGGSFLFPCVLLWLADSGLISSESNPRWRFRRERHFFSNPMSMREVPK